MKRANRSGLTLDKVMAEFLKRPNFKKKRRYTIKDLAHINIAFINHDCQRYDTAGDYQELSPCVWNVHVSKMGNWRYQYMVMIHELVEMGLTRHNGVDWKDIDKFDMDNPDLEDPGTCPKAPYHHEHMFAMRIEKMLCTAFGISWDEYNKAFDRLKWRAKK